MATMARVRVGIVSWNCAEVLSDCLAALPAALDGMDAEIVVVDNASDDESVGVAQAAGATTVGNPTNIGYGRAMNQALAGTAAPVLVALNPDTVPLPGSLARLVATLEAHPDAGVVLPRLHGADGEPQWSLRPFPDFGITSVTALLPRRWWPRRVRERLGLPDSAPTGVAPVDWGIGAVHVLRSSAVHDHRVRVGEGVYSERWFIYVEDLDLCWRLARAGWRTWYDPAAEVRHVGGASADQAFGGAARLRWLHESYDWYACTRGTPRTRVYAALLLLAELWRRRGGWRRPTVRLHLRTLLRGPRGPLPHEPLEPVHRTGVGNGT